MSTLDDREFDVIVWGATGFTGRLVAEYLLGRYGVGNELRWAIGGRNADKLASVRAGLGDAAEHLELVIGDSADPASMQVLANRTRVVATTVGPYALYGSELVAACAAAGTDYCDLTGEVQWMRRMIDAHHDQARRSGARIIHTCGFDSIPSDLGVHFLQREMRARHGTTASTIKFRTRGFRGGFSGGTIASMLTMLDMADRDRQIAELLKDPYALNPEGERRGLDGPDAALPAWDADFSAWVAPFVMGAINMRVVRRSNALAGYPYGHEFRYDEASLMPFGPFGFALAAGLSAGSSLFSSAASFRPLRDGLARLLPAPGQGPSAAEREAGYFDVALLGKSAEGSKCLQVAVRGDRDPGYGSTSKMLGEAAACLALDPRSSEGGVLTPSVAMGDALLERLPQNAGVTFEVEER